MHQGSRRSAIPPFYVMEIYGAAEERRRLGEKVYNLAAGQPSTGAPAEVIAAAATAAAQHTLGYTDALGIAPLREAIAQHTLDWYGVEVPTRNVIVTTGSSGGFLVSFLACFDPGDVVAMARPGYPAYRNILASLGCEVLEFDCGPEQGYLPTVATLEALPTRPDGLILASPANPTGAMIDPVTLAEIVAWCELNGVRFISDELYHGISYAGPGHSAWEYGRQSIVVNSFSKYFSMTGWRLGWLLVPDELLDPVFRMTGNYTICPPALSQFAGIAAFSAYETLNANVERYAANRALLLEALPAIGLPHFAPADGAFYVYADVSDYTQDSLNWVRRLLAETGVALAPGLDFDPVNGHSFARFSFAGATDEIEQAVSVLSGWLAR